MDLTNQNSTAAINAVAPVPAAKHGRIGDENFREKLPLMQTGQNSLIAGLQGFFRMVATLLRPSGARQDIYPRVA